MIKITPHNHSPNIQIWLSKEISIIPNNLSSQEVVDIVFSHLGAEKDKKIRGNHTRFSAIKICCLILHCKHNLQLIQIGAMLGIRHPTVLYHINTISEAVDLSSIKYSGSIGKQYISCLKVLVENK